MQVVMKRDRGGILADTPPAPQAQFCESALDNSLAVISTMGMTRS